MQRWSSFRALLYKYFYILCKKLYCERVCILLFSFSEPINADEEQMKAALNRLPLPGVNVVVRRIGESTFQIEFADSNRGTAHCI